jgi:protein-tyrosine phosphatase
LIRVAMVCLGNICRSPMAEAVFRGYVTEAGLSDKIEVVSAGTGHWNVGSPPHPETLDEIGRHGMTLNGKQAIHLRSLLDEAAADPKAEIDYFIAMDRRNRRDMERGGLACTLLLDFADPVEVLGEREVPDPYLEGGFDVVYRLVDAGCRGLLATIVEEQDWE